MLSPFPAACDLQAFPTVTHLIIRAGADDTTLNMIGHNMTTLKHLELYNLAVGYSRSGLKGKGSTRLGRVLPEQQHAELLSSTRKPDLQNCIVSMLNGLALYITPAICQQPLLGKDLVYLVALSTTQIKSVLVLLCRRHCAP